MENKPDNLRTVNVTRYATPLREGGSLPAIVEADDDFLYVLKFRGAGQGQKALIAELIAGEISRLMALKIPEIVLANVDEAFGRTEPDEEIQDLLRASEGLNLALHYLSGSVTYDPLINKVDAELASKIVWLDALIMNVDRTPRNTNMLMWHKELWLIDHGAAFYFHHSWQDLDNQYKKPFPQIKDHVLLPFATQMKEVDAQMKEIFNLGKIKDIVNLVPDEWLQDEYSELNESQRRNVYIRFLEDRIANSHLFVNEAENARKALI